MANQPFDRTIIHPREKPLSSDIDQLQSELDRSLRFFARYLLADQASSFMGNSLLVTAQSPVAMAVNVTPGLAWQSNSADSVSGIDAGDGPVVGLNDLAVYKPIPLLSIAAFTVPTAPAAPNTRIDIIEVKASRLITDATSRQVLNALTGKFSPETINKALQWALDGRTGSEFAPADSTQPLSYKIGVSGNPGVAPAVTPGYVKVAEIAVGSDVTSIGSGDITDSRVGMQLQSLGILDDLTVGGLTTLNDDVTLAAGKHVRVSGTGRFKHGEVQFQKGVLGGYATAPTADWALSGEFGIRHNTVNSGSWMVDLDIPVGARLKQVLARIEGHASKTITLNVLRCADGVTTNIGNDVSATSATWQTLDVPGLSEVVVANTTYVVGFTAQAVAGTVTAQGITYVYDWP